MIKKLKLTLVSLAIVVAGAVASSPVAHAADCGDQKDTYFDWGCDASKGDGISQLVWAVFTIVSGVVAAACLGAIVFGAIRYSSANSNASAAKEGLDIIRNAIIALVLYGCFWALVALLINDTRFGP
ncbi:hypothetical protein FWF93_00075 [Candidatus Saccharibacteria bacterium]|nr:hypothetical protein [Candidatus Saccharibacteria bacterium]